MNYQTGYFADMKHQRNRKVHIVGEDLKPICKSNPVGNFHWCTRYVALDYVNCSHCRRRFLVNEIARMNEAMKS